jgi:hypothetical protein
MDDPELIYDSELISSEWDNGDGTVTVVHDEVFAGIRCRRCNQPVAPPKQGFQPRCLNPECKNRGALRAAGSGKKPTRFTFTYADLAAATGLTGSHLRQLAHRKKFNPRDFASVAKLLRERGGSK